MTEVETGNGEDLKGKQGMERVLAATGYSIRGLRSSWQNEAAFREECILLCFFIPAAFWLGQGAAQIALLLMSCILVIIVELLNTAIEVVVDRVGFELHELSGRAKDTASSAVFLSLIQVPVVWGLVAFERFFS